MQPADPLELWKTPPFEPTLREEKGVKRMYGRGTSDDKGQFMTFVEAARAWIRTTGTLPIRATFLIEGEEDRARPRSCRSSRPMRKQLSCDAAFVCDTGMWDPTTPPPSRARLRGLVHEEVPVTGPRIDLPFPGCMAARYQPDPGAGQGHRRPSRQER